MSPEYFLDAITKSSPSYVILVDREGLIQYVNRVTKSLSKEEVLGQPIFRYATDQIEIDKIKACFKEVLELKESRIMESKAITLSGSNSYWETRVSPILKEKSVTGFILFANNITDRKAAEKEQHAIFNGSEDFLCILKFDGYFSRVNPAFLTKLGYTEPELLSIAYLDLIHPDDKPKSIAAFGNARTKDHRFSPFENRHVARDGSTLTIQWSVTADFEGKRLIAVGRDITKTRELEKQLAQAQKLDAIGQLAGGVAHDFNNSLMAISANAELGLISDDVPELKRRFTDIQAASAKAALLANKLLTFSRNQAVSTKTLDVNVFVESVTRKLKKTTPHSITVKLQLATGNILTKANHAQLEQVLANVYNNSIDAMPNGGMITISTKLESTGKNTEIVLEVEDSGTGIASELLSKVFDPFFSTKKDGHGTGLGLATAYGVVKKHEGEIRITQTSPAGTKIQIRLPAVKKLTQADNSKNEALQFGGSETILLVEDDILVANVATATLNKSGYTVLQASNGLEAIQLCKDHPSIQLIFMDVVMPEMGGPEAAEIIREMRPTTPILFASGYSPDNDQNTLNEYPILNKPYRSDVLLNTVREMLEAS